MKLLVSAAETSADLHAAQVVARLRSKVPNLRIMGIGGPALRAQGLEPVARAEDLAVMGSFEILSKFRKITAARKAVLELAARERPDLALLVDYPGFHFNVAPRLKALGIRIAYFIPPKVWVWKKGRIQQMKAWVDRVFCVLPFEAPLYTQAGIRAEFVGSPLVDELPWMLSRQEARRELGLDGSQPLLAVLPGSRDSELEHHLVPFVEAARSFASANGMQVLVVLPEGSDLARWKAFLSRTSISASVVSWQVGRSGHVLRAADLGLIKSGTATLEAAILECPMVVAYRPGQFTSWAVKNVIRYRGPVALANLYEQGPLTRETVVPEVLHDEVTSSNLQLALERVWGDPMVLARMRQGLSRIRELALRSAEGVQPSERVADGLIRMWGEPK